MSIGQTYQIPGTRLCCTNTAVVKWLLFTQGIVVLVLVVRVLEWGFSVDCVLGLIEGFSDTAVTVCRLLEYGWHLDVVWIVFWNLAALSMSRKQVGGAPPLLLTLLNRIWASSRPSASELQLGHRTPLFSRRYVSSTPFVMLEWCSSSSRNDSVSNNTWRLSSVGDLRVSKFLHNNVQLEVVFLSHFFVSPEFCRFSTIAAPQSRVVDRPPSKTQSRVALCIMTRCLWGTRELKSAT